MTSPISQYRNRRLWLRRHHSGMIDAHSEPPTEYSSVIVCMMTEAECLTEFGVLPEGDEVLRVDVAGRKAVRA